jgi:hypothetical protein
MSSRAIDTFTKVIIGLGAATSLAQSAMYDGTHFAVAQLDIFKTSHAGEAVPSELYAKLTL